MKTRSEKLIDFVLGAAALLFLVALFTPAAHAATVVLNWTPPTQRVDNTPLPASEIANYGVYMATAPSEPYTHRENAAGGTNRTHRLLNVPPGRRCFLLRTRDTATALESENSNAICIDVPAAPPKSPTAVTVTVTIEIAPATP